MVVQYGWLDCPWQIRALLFILLGRIVCPIFNKLLANDVLKSRNLLVQYAMATIATVWAGYVFGADFASPRLLPVLVLGMLNALGLYYYWKAAGSSLSRSSILSQLDDLIAIGLGFAVLREDKLINWRVGLGAAIVVAAAMMFTSSKSKKMSVIGSGDVRKNRWDADGVRMLRCILVSSGIWGIVMFYRRYFASGDTSFLSLPGFVAAFYAGAFIGSLAVYFLKYRAELCELAKPGAKTLTAAKRFSLVFCTMVIIVLCNAIGYWIVRDVPITVFQPVDQGAEMVFPTLVGLFIFREKDSVSVFGWLAMAVGVAGSAMIIFSF